MSQVIFASHNQGKIREVAKILSLPDLELLSMDDAGLAGFEVEETGVTFEENALLKAEVVARKSGLNVIADDSGLEVFALGNRPGVYSARFAPGTDRDRCQKVLEELGSRLDRSARFVCVFAWVDNLGNSKLFSGELEGTINFSPKGSDGFGYDPIFIPNDHAQTLAELGDNIKNQISHRARALAKFKDWWLSK